MTIRAIWAQTPEGVIGDGEKLLWRLPEDLKYFSAATRNGTVVMGRRTWDSLPERYKPLPERKNIVISRSMAVVAGAEVSSNLSETLQNRSGGDLWVIGGGEIYYQAMPYLKELYITQVYLTGVVGSAVAPDYEKDFSLTAATPIQVSSTGIEYRFEIWSRNV